MAGEMEQQQKQPESERIGDVQSRRAKPALLAAIVIVSSAIGIVLGLLIDWMPTVASTQLDEINTLYDVLIIFSVPIFVLVQAYVLYAVWRWRMRKGEEELDGPPIHGNTRLEVIWTLIPALLMLGLTTYSYIVLKDIEEAPAAGQELNVRVVGEQFTWTFYYPQQGGEEVASSQLYVPEGRSVKFTVQAKDVLHDFWVPGWGMKIDAVPGIDTSIRVTPSKRGNFPVVCAELCGLGHAVMRQTARVVTQEDFDQWLTEQREGGREDDEVVGSGGQVRPGDVDGKSLFTSVEPNCGSCHTLADAGTSGTIGPNLDESLKGKDADYIRAGIVEPERDIAEGFAPGIMPPNYGDTLDPTEVDALVEYLEQIANG